MEEAIVTQSSLFTKQQDLPTSARTSVGTLQNVLRTMTMINQRIEHHDNNQPTHCAVRQQSTNTF
jgi:hypothetical protein